MFVYKSRFLTRGEVWFDESPDSAPVDWIYHRQRSSPLPEHRWRCFYTLVIDLRKTAAELLAEMDGKTARRITEAQELEKLWCERCDPNDTEPIDQVEEMWNLFAVAHKTPPLERHWLDRIREAGALELVAAKDSAGSVLAYHLVLLTAKRARQLIAISPFKLPDLAWRNRVSRANCLVHWHNFQAFREQGIAEFDFGGWYPGTTDIRLLGINRFKKGFGGRIVCEYDCDQPVTPKGWVLLTAAQLMTRLRRVRPSARPDTEGNNHAIQREAHEISPAFR